MEKKQLDGRDWEIITERIFKFLMFAVAAFCTGGTIFIAYAFYHAMKCDKELRDHEIRKLPLAEQPGLAEVNRAKNLTEEDKKFFYEHPLFYKKCPETNTHSPYVAAIFYDHQITNNKFKIDTNPRFADGEQYDLWWNKPYWDRIIKSRKDYKERNLREYVNKLNKEKHSKEFWENELKELEQSGEELMPGGTSKDDIEDAINFHEKNIRQIEKAISVWEAYEDYTYLLKKEEKEDA